MPPSALMQDEEHKPSPKEELHRGMAKGLASAALAMPGRGKAGRILKGAVAGAAAGAEIEAAYHKYKARRKKARARKATTTVTQSAMAQKAQYHKKDKTSTEKL
jgi:outer membrane lipoprotein SlyB